MKQFLILDPNENAYYVDAENKKDLLIKIVDKILSDEDIADLFDMLEEDLYYSIHSMDNIKKL